MIRYQSLSMPVMVLPKKTDEKEAKINVDAEDTSKKSLVTALAENFADTNAET